MNNLRVIFNALKISVRVKGTFSMIAGVLGFGTMLLPVLLAQLLRILTDKLQGLSSTSSDWDVDAVFRIFAALVLIYVVQLILNNLSGYEAKLDLINIQRYIKRTIMRHKCEVRYKYIENYDNFQKRIAFTEEFAGYQLCKCIRDIFTTLQLLIGFTVTSLTLWQVNPFIVIILFVTSIPAALMSYYQQDETFRFRAKWMEEGSLAIHYFHVIAGGEGSQSLSSLQEIRHFALFDYLKARWRAIADEYIGKKNAVMSKHVRFNTAADFFRSVVYMGILLIAAAEIYKNPAIGLGVFTLVFTLSGQLQSVAGDMLVNIMVTAQNVPYMKEFFYLDSLEREATQPSAVPIGTAVYSPCSGDITFEHVTFAYPNTEIDVLKDINVRIKDGEKIAVVGENGSGKSTFVSLLCGMFDPQHGRINVGGTDIKEDPSSVRASISAVFQDFARYEADLRDNICVSAKNRNASDDEIMELLRRINADDVVNEQPNGLDELVGSFSSKANDLSGGQWQKISIARAAYRNDARIMILDEPTAALDPVAEAQLYRNFTELTGEKTTILISHRLGITAVVDRILVFDGGCIVEDGSHKELMSRNGLYARMYRAQAQWYSV